MADWTKTGTSKAGVSAARKVQCSKSKFHGFHPENEDCPDCDPVPAKADPGYNYWSGGMYTNEAVEF